LEIAGLGLKSCRLSAALSTLESAPGVGQLKGICIDVRESTHATLDDSDRERVFLLRKLESYSQDISLINKVAIINPEAVDVNNILVERNRRVKAAIFGFAMFEMVFSEPDALGILGLPVDYRIEFSAETVL
jgi:hypothetical protein